MNQEVLEYLQRQLALGKQRLKRYVSSPGGKIYPKRYIYVKVKQYIEDFLKGNYNQKRWVIIPGLRGTGKTTILAQLYYDLSSLQSEDINLIYFSLNEATETVGSDLNTILKEYERIIGESYEVLTKPTFILIDEVQSDPKWAGVLRALNDRTEKVFVICSGSSAVHFAENGDVSGRRAAIERLYPMSFCEFEMVHNNNFPDKGLKNELKYALYNHKTAQEAHANLLRLKDRVDRYWAKVDRSHWRFYLGAGSLPFALVERSLPNIYDSILASIDKVVTKDIQQLSNFDPNLKRFSPDTIPVIKRLLYILAESDSITNQKLADVLQVNHITIANIFDVLVQAELLIRIPPHGSQIGAAKRPYKYLFMSSAVRAAYFHIAGSQGTSLTREGRLLEDVAGLHYYRMFDALKRGEVTYDSAMGGADFILKVGEQQVAVEIGRGAKTARQVADTMKRVECKYGLVINHGPLELALGGKVVMVPWDFFALI